MRFLTFLGMSFVLLQGCKILGGYGFTEADDGDSSKFLSGRMFVVSLPASDENRVPLIRNGEIVRFVGFKKDEGGTRDVFEFKAAVAGETEIKIPKDGNPASGFYTFTAKVVLGGSPY